MQNLLKKLQATDALFKPASNEEIQEAESQLGILFSEEYRQYLNLIGVISYESNEIYGLGIPKGSYLSLFTAIPDFRKLNHSFPTPLVPLCDIGDGHYYVYDNINRSVYVFVSPQGEVQRKLDLSLEDFLISILFK